MAKALTYYEISKRFKTCRANDPYTLITKETAENKILSRTSVIIKHDKCGNTLETRFQHFVNDGKGRCLYCYPIIPSGNSTKRVTLEDMIKRIQEVHPDVEFHQNFEGMKKRCGFRHTLCGTEYTAIPSDLLRRGNGCPVCANKKRGKYIQTETYLQDIIIDGYVWLEDYQGDNKNKHKIKHKSCGLEYTVRPNDFQQGYRCPDCSEKLAPLDSRNAKRIEKTLKEYGLTFHKEYIDKRCKSDKNGQLRFDFAIEYDDGRLIIIEYDGEFHDGEFYDENIKNEWTKRAVANTIRRDKINDKFVKDHPEKYTAMHRITHKDPVIETLNKILEIYYEFQ